MNNSYTLEEREFPLDGISITGEYQLREETELDDVFVQELVGSLGERVKSGEAALPVEARPILWTKPSGDTVIISGHHRVEALRRLGHENGEFRFLRFKPEAAQETVEATALILADRENDHSGSPKRKTLGDRKKFLRKLLEFQEYRNLAASRLAQMTGLSDMTVAKVKAELKASGMEFSDSMVTADGKRRSTKAPRPKPEVPAEEPVEEETPKMEQQRCYAAGQSP